MRSTVGGHREPDRKIEGESAAKTELFRSQQTLYTLIVRVTISAAERICQGFGAGMRQTLALCGASSFIGGGGRGVLAQQRGCGKSVIATRRM